MSIWERVKLAWKMMHYEHQFGLMAIGLITGLITLIVLLLVMPKIGIAVVGAVAWGILAYFAYKGLFKPIRRFFRLFKRAGTELSEKDVYDYSHGRKKDLL
jgi:hypothetical protein